MNAGETRNKQGANFWVVVSLTLAVQSVSVSCVEPPKGPRYAGAGRSVPHRGGVFVAYGETDVRGLDPHVAFDEASIVGIKLIFDGLLDYDYQSRLIPQIATSLPEITSGGTLFRFTLRKGVRFHNGRELKATDVKWSMERMLSPQVNSPGYTFYTLIEGLDAFRNGKSPHISGIKIVDPYTIDFQLTKPDQTFLNAMAMTFAHPVARESYEHGASAAARHPIGTGPFVLESWDPGVRMTYRRNRSYWHEELPYLDRIVYELNLGRTPAFMRFRGAELDHVNRFAPADYLFLRHASKWKPYMEETSQVNIWGLVMNCELPPFDNVHVRRAVAFAIDRERWNRARAYRLHPTGQPIPPGLLGYDPNLPGQHRYDLRRAKQEMQLAGYPNGWTDEITLWLGEGPNASAIGELAQEDLRKIGLQIRLKPVAFPIYLQETGKPRTAQMLMSGWSQDFPDPADFLDILFHSRAIHERDSENRSFYRNAELDELLDRARVELDSTKRAQMYRRAQEIVVRDAPWAFLWNDRQLEAWQPYVKGYRQHPVWSQYYRNIWLDLPRKEIAQNYSPFLEGLAQQANGDCMTEPYWLSESLTRTPSCTNHLRGDYVSAYR